MSNYYNNKKNDMRKEEQVSRLLVNSFFKPILKSSDLITDKQKQYAGIDIETKELGNIDLKSAVTRLDGGLKTFCLEMFYTNIKGDLTKGWFYNSKNLQTDYYSFNYFEHSKQDGSRYMNDISDIGKSEIIIVDKNKLIEFMEKYWNNDIKQKTKKLINSNYNKIVIDEFVSVHYSRQLSEKPLNLLINKNKLIDLSSIHVKINHKTNNKIIFKNLVSIN